MTKYSNEWYKNKYYEVLKKAHDYLGGKCKRCIMKINLQIHHKDPKNKSFTVTEKLHNTSWDKILIELDKCELLCNDCHKKEHKSKCGTIGKYRRGCRCVECKTALRDYFRLYRKNKKTPA